MLFALDDAAGRRRSTLELASLALLALPLLESKALLNFPRLSLLQQLTLILSAAQMWAKRFPCYSVLTSRSDINTVLALVSAIALTLAPGGVSAVLHVLHWRSFTYSAVSSLATSACLSISANKNLFLLTRVLATPDLAAQE